MFIDQFDELFSGRRDVYAEGYPSPKNAGKFWYTPVRESFDADVFKDHLNGKRCIGVYPIVDNKVGWFAVDFDAPKDPVDDPFMVVWQSALAQVEVFERAGLIVYLERSRGGGGVHIWGFFDEQIDAGIVRQALRGLLTDDEIFRDRVYPVQDTVEVDGVGSLIALPFYGAVRDRGFSSFLDPQTQEVIPPRTWIAEVKRNSALTIHNLAAEAAAVVSVQTYRRKNGKSSDPVKDMRPETPLVGALKVISPYGCQFMRHCWTDRQTLSEPEWYAAVQQATCFRNGREFAHAISRDYLKDGQPAYDAAAVDTKFDQALRNPPIGCNWIHDNYPNFACDGCPMKAPYHLAKRGLLSLVGAAAQPMEHVGSFDADIDRIKRFDAREIESGLKWGIPGLDRYTRLRPCEMTVIGAMQSIGKTHLMIDALYRLSKAGVPVFVFSAETGRQSLRQRILGRAAEVDTLALRGERVAGPLTTDELKRIRKAAKEVEKLPIYLDYTSLAADTVLDQVEDTILRYGVALDAPYVIFFDYLQFGSKIGDDRTEYDRVTRLSTEFKFTAKVLEKPVVVFSQLIRAAEGDNEPNLTWFKNTGRIESDMDVGIIITGDRVEGSRAPRTMHFVKQREGQSNVKIEFMLEQSISRYDERRVQIEAPARAVSEDGGFGI